MQKHSNKTLIAIPDMPSFVRDVTEYGNIGAIVRRFLKLSFVSMLTLAWWNKTNIVKLAKKDFAAGVTLLVQMELLTIAKTRRSQLFLCDQITDLAVALGNTAIIVGYMKAIKQIGLQSGFITNNLITTSQMLHKLNIHNTILVFPFNSFGYEMNPGQKVVEQRVKLLDPQFVYAIVPEDTPRERAYLKRFNLIHKVVGWF